MGQASHPPHPIRRRQRAVAVSAPVIVVGAAKSADENAILFVQGPTAPTASRVRAAKPGALPLRASDAKGPLLLKLDDLCLTVDGDGDLGPAQTTDAQYGVVFQKLAVLPFPFSPSAACSESRDHWGESNLYSCATISI